MNAKIISEPLSRRKFFAASLGVTALGLAGTAPFLHAARKKEEIVYPKGHADHCIFIWLGGGACHIDTWDPKRKGDGKKKPGSYYDPIATAIKGAHVCQHLGRTAPLLDRASIIRTLHHDIASEHAAATNRLHTGRPVSGTIVYPSLGA